MRAEEGTSPDVWSDEGNKEKARGLVVVAMSVEFTDRARARLLAAIQEMQRLEKVSDRELVQEALSAGLSDFPIVEAMMSRLDPDWAKEEE